MSNNSQDSGKKVINPLFSASVTGGTFEDFSQNALLFPAQINQLPRSGQRSLSQSPLTSGHTPGSYQPNITSPPSGEQLEQASSDQFPTTHTRNPSNFASSPSSESISSVLTFSPSGPDTNLVQTPLLFNPIQQSVICPSSLPPINKKSVNTYRRIGQKRPVYAPIPGLSSGHIPTLSSYQDQTPSPECNISSVQHPVIGNQTILQPAKSISPSDSKPSVHFLPSSSLPPTNSSQFQEITFDEAYSQLQPQNLNEETYFRPELSGYSAVPAAIDALPIISSNIFTPAMNAMSTQPLPPIGTSLSSTISDVQYNSASMNNLKSTTNMSFYRPVYHHWFHKRELEGRIFWDPFTMSDSLTLEEAFTSAAMSPEKMVATDGGRFDVNILRRERKSVYWKSEATEVRRCSWFYKNTADGKLVPYDENISTRLEEEYKIAFETNQWHRKVKLPTDEIVVMHSPSSLELMPAPILPEAWVGSTPSQARLKVLKRGMDEFEIDEDEPTKIDHLLFLVHGIGSVCDLKFRTVEEVVNEFRSICLQLVKSHYRSSCDKGIVNRIEVLPISWYDQLHSEDTGIDKKLKSITLDSIPRLRDFTNETLLDVLFYNSPVYSQTIIGTVGGELNRIHDLFKLRNPDFEGSISLGGHSLGSLILFDLLCHQSSDTDKEENVIPEDAEINPPQSESKQQSLQKKISRRISYTLGKSGTGQPLLHYPHLNFNPIAFFALGSPIGMFVTVRGLDSLGVDFALPTCPSFFNIFHPFDPVAYRIESLINSELSSLRPVLIPHHKGRKRMHLELKETMVRVGADIKQKIIDSMRSTWNSFYQLARFHKADNHSLEEEMDKVLEEQLNQDHNSIERERSDSRLSASDEEADTSVSCGILNGGRRIDYVLQEAPFEIFNEYIFALTSHVCYWESEDTMLLILKEIYNTLGVSTDNKIPQQTMTIERTQVPIGGQFSELSAGYSTSPVIDVDPTMPTSSPANVGPPPITGFVRKN